MGAIGVDQPVRAARRRIAWPVEQWPEPDRAAWELACRPGDYLDEAGGAAAWRPASVKAATGAYGRWLAFLDDRGLLDVRQSPAARMNPATLGTYVEHLRERCSSKTVASTVAHLEMMIRVLAPAADRSWLRRLEARLQRRAVPCRNKRVRVVSTRDLLALGKDLMGEAERQTEASPSGLTHGVAVTFRDGLMIALLSLRPLRRKNFMALELGRTLVANGSGYAICFGRNETKTKQPIDLSFPESLVPALQRYLDVYRPFLLSLRATRGRSGQDGVAPGGRLWINQYGQAMTGGGAITPISKRTRTRFGHHVNPHLFRDCAATTIATEDPKHVRISAPVLGHTDFRTTEAHYIAANARIAGAAYHDLIAVKRAAGSKTRTTRERTAGTRSRAP